MPSTQFKEGDPAPDFTLESDAGTRVSLRDFRGKTVVLYFYPRDNTPGCTTEACDFRDSFARFNGIAATVLGVSTDSVERHRAFKAKHGLEFALLSDPDGEVCRLYGVMRGKPIFGMPLLGFERATFVIGPDGRIRKVFPKVKVRGHIEEVLAACKD